MSNETIACRLDAARNELLDLGLRNTLLNFHARKNTIVVDDELSKEVYHLLVEEQKEMFFLHVSGNTPSQHSDINNSDSSHLSIEWAELFNTVIANEASDVLNSQKDLYLQSSLTQADLQKNLICIHGGARTAIEETGANILYLALGFLTWYEDENSKTEHKAPLILLPVSLERRNVNEQFSLRWNREELSRNLSLEEMLRSSFGIEFPQRDNWDELDVEQYFHDIENTIATQTRWFISPNEIALGFFSFNKFLMYRDLEPSQWSVDASSSFHPTMEALLGSGFCGSSTSISDDKSLNRTVEADDMFQVLDADSSQTQAIIDILEGKNLVIQGPPGTGKSQTITNIITEGLAAGKKILFVADKMAALDVVKRRLEHVGVSDAVLELHSHSMKKRAMREELKRTLTQDLNSKDDEWDGLQTLVEQRNRLNSYCNAANTPILNSQVTPVQAMGISLAKAGSTTDLPSIDFDVMRDWSMQQYHEALNHVSELQQRLQKIGGIHDNPFRGSYLKVLMPLDKENITNLIKTSLMTTVELRLCSSALAERLGLDSPCNVSEVMALCRAAVRVSEAPLLTGLPVSDSRWHSHAVDIDCLLSAGKNIVSLRAEWSGQLIDEAWEQDLTELRQHLIIYGDKWWRRISAHWRDSRDLLARLCRGNPPKLLADRVSIVDAMLDAQRAENEFRTMQQFGSELFAHHWRDYESDWKALEDLARWSTTIHEDVNRGYLPKNILKFLDKLEKSVDLQGDVDDVIELVRKQQEPLEQLGELLVWQEVDGEPETQILTKLNLINQEVRLQILRDNMPLLEDLVRYNVFADELRSKDLGHVLNVAERWEDAVYKLIDAFEHSWYQGLLDFAFIERPELAGFDRVGHEHAIDTFKILDQKLLEVNRKRVLNSYRRQLAENTEDKDEIAIVRREITRRKGHQPIRRLMESAGRGIQAIKPVFMMSPKSIAQFLPPGALEFDWVIFDEASQMRPIDAFGAILRGKQLIVVGDSNQLPPTNFFDSLNMEADPEEDSVVQAVLDIESVLDLCVAQNVHQRMLRWHYRSRHESLIAISNLEFYDNKLMVFPNAGGDSDAEGLVFNYFPETHYDRGASKTNQAEALAVAEAVMMHARNRAHLTLGVVAFSAAQREAIELQLELLRRSDLNCEEYFNSSSHEPFFIKNLENVQGDERDVILISIGYGRTSDGSMSMNFGPLNQDGGERRLNVLITRARMACHVFSNFTADEIDVNRSNSRGVLALKNFLSYAKTRVLKTACSRSEKSNSPFEEEVFAALVREGWQVQSKVGVADFRIDLGVIDPKRDDGAFLLGIECDGESYHSLGSTRDRDRLRNTVLEQLGWHLYRVWSVEWYRNPKDELQRLCKELEKVIPKPLDRDVENNY